jgi:hypothetical protein
MVVPAAKPETMPEPAPTVAIPADEEVQNPPDELFDNVIDWPTQTLVVPDMGAGNELIVTMAADEQPVGNV